MPTHAPELTDTELADVAASFQEAIVDVLTAKAIRAARTLKVTQIAVGGGVAANAHLRTKLTCAAEAHALKVYFPPIGFCTDNAVMIAGLGYHHLKGGKAATLDIAAFPQVERI